MRTRSLIIAALCGVSILGWTLGHATGPAVAARECPADVGAADRAQGIAAGENGRGVGAAGSSPDPSLDARAVARQVATNGGGAAYVWDRRGADAIVLSTPDGARGL